MIISYIKIFKNLLNIEGKGKILFTKSSIKKTGALGVAVLAFSLLLSSCGSDTANTTDKKPSTSTSSAAETTAATNSNLNTDAISSSETEKSSVAPSSSSSDNQTFVDDPTQDTDSFVANPKTTEEDQPFDTSDFPDLDVDPANLHFGKDTIVFYDLKIPTHIGNYRVVDPAWYSKIMEENGKCTKRLRITGSDDLESNTSPTLTLYYLLDEAVSDEQWWNLELCTAPDLRGGGLELNVWTDRSKNGVAPESTETPGKINCFEEAKKCDATTASGNTFFQVKLAFNISERSENYSISPAEFEQVFTNSVDLTNQ